MPSSSSSSSASASAYSIGRRDGLRQSSDLKCRPGRNKSVPFFPSAVDARLLAHKPRTIDMRQAAALPLVFITAWEGLVDRAHIEKGQNVLVHGGAGGVGHVAIQIANAFGAKVFATGSAKSLAYIESLHAMPIDRGRASRGLRRRTYTGRRIRHRFRHSRRRGARRVVQSGEAIRSCRQCARLGNACARAAVV